MTTYAPPLGRGGLLRDRDFRLLLVSRGVGQMGSRLTVVTLPLAALLALHVTAFQAGLLVTLRTLPFLLVGLPAGAWVDRMRRRGVLLTTGAVYTLVMASVPIAWWSGALTLAQLYAVALLLGVCNVFSDVAYQSFLPFLVGRANLVEGNARLQMVESVATVGGPGVAGLLVQWLTAPLALVADAVGRVCVTVCVGLIRRREPAPERSGERHLLREVREGVAFVLGHRFLRPIAAATSMFNLFYGANSAMLVVLLADVLHLPSALIGVFFGIGGAGSVLAALLAGRFSRRVGPGVAIWLPMVSLGPAALLVPLAGHGWWFGLAGLGMFVSMACVVLYNVSQVSYRQTVCPENLLGRMNATMRFLVWGTMPLGSFLGGAVAQWTSVRTSLWIAAAGMSLAFLPVLCSPLRRAAARD